MSAPSSSLSSCEGASSRQRTHCIYALATLLGVSASNLHKFLYQQRNMASGSERTSRAGRHTVTTDILLAAVVQVVTWPYIAFHDTRRVVSTVQCARGHSAGSLRQSQDSFIDAVPHPHTPPRPHLSRPARATTDDLRPQTAIAVLPHSWPARHRRDTSPEMHGDVNAQDSPGTARELCVSPQKRPLRASSLPSSHRSGATPLSSAQAARLAQPCIERFFTHLQRLTSGSATWTQCGVSEAMLQRHAREAWRLLPPILHSTAGIRRVNQLCPDFVPSLLSALLAVLSDELDRRTPGDGVAGRAFSASPSSLSLELSERIGQSPNNANRASGAAPSVWVTDRLFPGVSRPGERGKENSCLHHDVAAAAGLTTLPYVTHCVLHYLLPRYAAVLLDVHRNLPSALHEVHDMVLQFLYPTQPCLATVQLCAALRVAGVVPGAVSYASDEYRVSAETASAIVTGIVRGGDAHESRPLTLCESVPRLVTGDINGAEAVDAVVGSPYRLSSPSPRTKRPEYVCALTRQLRGLVCARGVAIMGETTTLVLSFLYATEHLLALRGDCRRTRLPYTAGTAFPYDGDVCDIQPQSLVTSCRQLQSLVTSPSASSCTTHDILLVTCCVLTLPPSSCASDKLVAFMAQWLVQALAALLAPHVDVPDVMTAATTMLSASSDALRRGCARDSAVCAACVSLSTLLNDHTALLLRDLVVPSAPWPRDTLLHHSCSTFPASSSETSALSESQRAAHAGGAAAPWSCTPAEPLLSSPHVLAATATVAAVYDPAGHGTDAVMGLAARAVTMEAVRLALLYRLARAVPIRTEGTSRVTLPGSEIDASSAHNTGPKSSNALYALCCALRLLRRAKAAHPVGLTLCAGTQRSMATAMTTIAVLLLLRLPLPPCRPIAVAPVLVQCFQVICGVLDQVLHDYTAGYPRTLCACLTEFGQRNVALLGGPAHDSYATPTTVWQALRQVDLWECYATELETIEAASHIFAESDDADTTPPPTTSLLGYLPCAANAAEAEAVLTGTVFDRRCDGSAGLEWTQHALRDVTAEWWSVEERMCLYVRDAPMSCDSSCGDCDTSPKAAKRDGARVGWDGRTGTTRTSTLLPTSTVAEAAYRDEADKLREALRLLAQEKGSSGVLEGKYLEQIKKCRTLTVKLEAEKTRATRLERELQVLQTSHGSANAGGTAGTAKASRSHTKDARDGKSPRQPGISSGGEAGADETPAIVKSLKERLDRVYKQLHEKETQLEEARREAGQLCAMLMYETGASKQEVLRAAREGVTTVEISKGVSGAGSLPAASAVAVTAAGSGPLESRPRIGQGWHSRAAQIILLRGKVKDLERALAEARTDVAGEPRDPPVVTTAETNGNESDAAVTPTVTLTGNIVVAPSAVSEAGRDVDDAARDHVARLESRRLCTQRELEAALAQSERELVEARRRQAAQQARFQLLQQRSNQLREYVDVILEKSAGDDELIAAYKAELEQLRRAALPQMRAGGDDGVMEMSDELHTLRRQVRQLQERLAASSGQERSGACTVLNELTAKAPTAANDNSAPLQDRLQRWVDEACRVSEIRVSDTDADGDVALSCLVGEVLRVAQAHVVSAEVRLQELERSHSVQLYDRYTRLLDSVGKRLTMASVEEGGIGEGADDVALMRLIASLPPIEPFVLQENKSLKQRVRTLTDMARKEAAAQRVRLTQGR